MTNRKDNEFKNEELYAKFKEYINELNNKYSLTPVMKQLANDVAWDMTEGWEDMEVDTVLKYFTNEKIFIEALKFGESEMRKELSGEIDFDNMDRISDNSNEYAFGSVEEKFYELCGL